MKSLVTSLALCLSVFFTTQAQDLENSLLWEISGNDLEKPSYLFGTIHITCDASLNANVKKALDNTTLLVLELDMDDPNLQIEMMQDIYMKGGKSIKDLVGEDDYKIISDFINEQLGMSLNAYNNVKPFFLSAMFYQNILDCPVQSYEMALMQVAHDQKEEVFGLETVSEQMSVFDSIPYEDQATDLLRTAKDELSYDKDMFQKLIKLYKNEDIQAMVEMMDSDKNLTSSKHKDKMLDNRNKNWISKIEAFSQKQPTFYGVGAAHLAGKNGVIQLLRNAGYTVTAVK